MKPQSLRLPPPLRTEVPEDLPEDDPEEWLASYHEDLLSPEDAYVPLREEAMAAIARGESRVAWADRLGVSPQRVGQLYHEFLRRGSRALKRWATRDAPRTKIPAGLVKVAKRLWRDQPAMSGSQIRKHKTMVDACASSGDRRPTAGQFNHLKKVLAEEDAALASPTARGRQTNLEAPGYYGIYGGRPGFVEFDEETTNLPGQLVPGTPDTARAHGLPAKDIGTKAPVGVVATMSTADQGDLRRLVQRIARPKDWLAKRAGAKHGWPIVMWPLMLRGDNAWINYAFMFLALVKEGILLEFAPAKRPERKGVVEAGIGQRQKIMENDQPHSTGPNPTARGRAKPERYAAERRITGTDIENDLVATDVDAVLYGSDVRGDRPPIKEWEAGVRKYGVRTWEGGDGRLVQLLKTPIAKPAKVTSHGVSWKGRDYATMWAGDPDDDPRNDLPYPHARKRFLRRGTFVMRVVDFDDVRMIDIYSLKGEFLGVAVCNKLGLAYGRAVSQFELDFKKELDRADKAEGTASREASREDRLRRNQALPKQRVARATSRIAEITERRRETVMGTAEANPKRRSGAKRPPAPPKVKDPEPMVFVRTAASFAVPQVTILGRAVPETGTAGATAQPRTNPAFSQVDGVHRPFEPAASAGGRDGDRNEDPESPAATAAVHAG